MKWEKILKLQFQTCAHTHTQNFPHPREWEKQLKTDSNHARRLTLGTLLILMRWHKIVKTFQSSLGSCSHNWNSAHPHEMRFFFFYRFQSSFGSCSHLELFSSSWNNKKLVPIMLTDSHSELISSSRDEKKLQKRFQSCSLLDYPYSELSSSSQ